MRTPQLQLWSARARWALIVSGALAASCGAAAALTTPTPTTVPFRIVGKSAPMVVIRIQDRDLPLWLDIGASSSLILHPSLLKELKTTPTGESFTGFGMEGKVITSPIVKVPRVGLGSAVFLNVSARADEHDDAYREKELAGRGAFGFVGAGFFANHKIVLDYRQRRLTLIPPGVHNAARYACRGKVVPLVQDASINWGLVSGANTDVGNLLFAWDTGSPALIMMKASATAAGLDASQDAVTLARVSMNGQDFGPLRFEIWDVPAAPAGMAGLIGYDFFMDHVVCIDFPGQRILVR